MKDDAHKRAHYVIQNYFKCFKYKHLSGAWYRIQLYQLLRVSMKINVIFALKRVYTCGYFKSTTYGLRALSLYTTKLITYEFVSFSLYSTKLPVGYLLLI